MFFEEKTYLCKEADIKYTSMILHFYSKLRQLSFNLIVLSVILCTFAEPLGIFNIN